MSGKSDKSTVQPAITRRDFVNGSMVGAGAALLGMASPAEARTASGPVHIPGQMVTSYLTGLGPDWTGPGGIGDYAHSNGNTADVVNAGHGAIRDDEFEKRLAAATDTGERPDLVVVGCGIAGLSACWSFRKERPGGSVLMLDNHPIFGGEAKQNEFEVDGYHLTAPQGSTGIVVPFRKAKEAGFWSPFAEELGFPGEIVFQKPTGLSKNIRIPQDPYTPMHIGWQLADTGFYYEGKGWIVNPWDHGFQGAPIPDSAKRALMQMELFRDPPRRPDWDKWLDSMTYLEFLRNVVGLEDKDLPYVTQYLNPQTAAMGCGLGADIISAYSAYNFLQPGVNGYYRYQNGGVNPADELYLATFPGGNSGTARCILKKIMPAAFKGEYRLADILNSPVQWEQLDKPSESVRMRLSSTVVSVVHEGSPGSAKGVVVTYLKEGRLYKVRAKAVVLCSQQHVNKHICRDLSPEYRQAMGIFNHAPMLVINVAVRNWKFLEKIGIAAARWFDFDGLGWWISLRRNLEIPGQVTQPLDPAKPFVFTMYNPFPIPGVPFPEQCTAARMEMFNLSYAQIESAVRARFTKLFGDYGFDAERDIAGIITNRQGHAYFVGPPGFFFGKNGHPAPKDVISKGFGRLSFGHSELSGGQMWETAAAEGRRAALQALKFT